MITLGLLVTGHCDDVGRDYDGIRKTILYHGTTLAGGDVDGFVDEMAEYAKLGVETVIVMPPGDRPAEWVRERCTPAVPRLAELGA